MMKTLNLILSSLGMIGLICTLICGFWMRANPAQVLESSRQFHFTLGWVSAVVSLCALGLVLLRGI
jgi:uncharacterized membrane protein